MDLAAEAQRLVLDDLAVRMTAVLAAAGVPHVLLKGPSTALWLYDPPRSYRDVDVLVPVSAIERCTSVLAESGIARPSAGRLGEEAPHSLMLRSVDGCEIDVHASLPTVPVAGDRIWDVLAEHVVTMDVGLGPVPVLDEPGRCLVLALHALNSGPDTGQPLRDLRLARERADVATWDAARRLAAAMHAEDLFAAGAALVEDLPTEPFSARARLYLDGAPSAAFGIARLADARKRELPLLLWREMFPSRGFMRYAHPDLAPGVRALIGAHARRWGRLAAQLPGALRAWRAARRR